ncbi:MAG: relaxase/mobilization nuclease domain-containing protein [Chitinophagaceae bacterium]
MKMGKSINGALNYNERKVRQGSAELIYASLFSRDIDEMGFSEKLLRFEKLNGLNEKSKTNTLHLSINFSPDDRLDTGLMQKLAADYMNRIGFGKQPFLVYQHNDTAHPHIHIVTTTIQANGKPIYLHNIGKRKSEPARKALEEEFGLIKAVGRQQGQAAALVADPLKAAHYGKEETKRIVSNIVREVTGSYKYASLEELNAVLRKYNLMADPGAPGSRMQRNGGLVYSLLDKKGQKIGVPIKASSIYSQPTLRLLEKKFQQNKVKKVAGKTFTANAVNDAINDSTGMKAFFLSLRKNRMACHIAFGQEKKIQEVFFIDYKKRTVYTATELGINTNKITQLMRHSDLQHATRPELLFLERQASRENSWINDQATDLLKNLLSAENVHDTISPEFLKKKKRRKRKQ